ncbi:MAG: hypothetical protein A3D31_19380 [Candidatus Fluviicola riflensis]|nr:MAG: hypothetical protein CHH17_06100 [Candidatus Fluviicola riflensis]OGS75948.1 MAG: hypothetical protein A3D31_19380 [Candidatus Fluviicola riflensis]OGS83628.1 MAG: hypothetical protein A2724_19395 [Fluviicola sp. RIFCSPHIGHO2_01_FULL_43_53]OGS85767.1 MAG: hypothetical protein A3E30_18925 [Fluviicola sp. RIFCSPHIGHO2_12_FULL_43_24]
MKTLTFLCLLGIILVSCKAQETDMDRYIKYQKYAPSKTLSYTYGNNYIEIYFPDKFKSKNRYVAFMVKDTITDTFVNSHSKHNTTNNVIRIDLSNKFQNTNNLILTNFFTWDDNFWVFGCCQIMRFHYISDQKGTLIYEPTCNKNSFYTFDKDVFEQEGNPEEEEEIRRFIIDRLSCD